LHSWLEEDRRQNDKSLLIDLKKKNALQFFLAGALFSFQRLRLTLLT